MATGRNEQVRKLAEQVLDASDGKPRVLCITGEAGVGKTSLAEDLVQAGRNSKRFDERTTVAINAYMDDWARVVTKLYRAMLGDLPANTNLDDLQARVISCIKHAPWLVLIDNADEVDVGEGKKIDEFIRQWLPDQPASLLITTTTQSPLGDGPAPAGCQVFELNGIEDRSAISNILGGDLSELIGDPELHTALKKLRGNPQKLKYLAWMRPRNPSTFRTCIEELLSPDAGSIALQAKLKKIEMPLTHFLALGRVRATEFDEGLLTFLWDRLGGGSTQTYVTTIERLLSDGLLTECERLPTGAEDDTPGEKDSRVRRFKMSAGDHMALEKPLRRYIGEKRIAHIDYFISKYYGTKFADRQNNGRLDLSLLEKYVYHALRSGNFESAYSYVFNSDVLESSHRNGKSLELEPILLLFDYHLGDISPRTDLDLPAEAPFAEKATRIKVELAHVYNDLSRHDSCLNCLEDADKILSRRAGTMISHVVRRRLQREIWYLSAISSSDLGRSVDCIDYYFRIVSDAVASNEFTSFDALCLGYLGHEVMFHKIDLAEDIGRKAKLLARGTGDHQVTIKNMCSLGQTLFFEGSFNASQREFSEADTLSKVSADGLTDSRELGRILIHSALLDVVDGRLDDADKNLVEGLELNTRFGDQRRAATATSYRSIVSFRRWRLNPKEEKEMLELAKKQMLEAIRQHIKISDWRNLGSEVLSYVYMEDQTFSGDLTNLKVDSLPKEIRDCVRTIQQDPNFAVFVEFWRRHVLSRFFLNAGGNETL